MRGDRLERDLHALQRAQPLREHPVIVGVAGELGRTDVVAADCEVNARQLVSTQTNERRENNTW